MQSGFPVGLFAVFLVVTGVTVVASGALDEGDGSRRDLWIHPRNETYDPNRHYRDESLELYYAPENDIGRELGAIVVQGGAQPLIRADLGADIWEFVERNGGSLRVVLHYDSDGDEVVDQTVRGRIEEGIAVFDSPRMAELDLRNALWQLGVVYRSGVGGGPQLDGRYLASVDSRSGRFQFQLVEDLVDVGADAPPGLVILRHREGAPFDFAAFSSSPTPYLDDFEMLTRTKDGDDWTVDETKGRLRTRFGREDLFLVRTKGDYTLGIVWGDMPLETYLETELGLERNVDGCYSTLDSQLEGDDGSRAPVPNRVLYCPEDSLALFDVPDGYQVFLSAYLRGEQVERTEASNSILDNFQLFAFEIHRRSASTRGTGTVWGNIRAGYRDVGDDLVDAGKHAVTGTYRRNVHTGQMQYRPSPITAVPLALWDLARLRLSGALVTLFAGAGSAAQIVADVVSATNNAVVNPVVQSTVGFAASPVTADTTHHWFGAFAQAAAQNLPFAERSVAALNPMGLWYHNRAFAPIDHTRTDTQLNIDRVMTLANLAWMYAVIFDGGSNGGGSRRSGGGDPPNGGGGGGAGGGGGGGGVPGGGCAVRGAPSGSASAPSRSANAIMALTSKFCAHPNVAGLIFGLPVKF